MRILYNNKFNLIHDDDFEPEDREEINLFIACMYLVVVALIGSLILFIYQNI